MKNHLIYASLVLMLVMGACREFIEPSISDRSVSLLAPAPQSETNVYKQVFWWEGVSDALFYRLQLVTPGFSKTERLILDTLVKANKFTYTLDPGAYEWRVRAENGSSATAYTTAGFIVHPSSITVQTVQLTAPANGLITNKTEVSYQWLNLYGATSYRLQVDQNNFADESKLLLNITTNQLTYVQQLTKEGNLQYRIRAENATENSKWSATGSLTFDNTPPEKVVLTAPANRSGISLPARLSWNSVSDADRYQLYVYKQDSTTVYSTAFPQTLTGSSYELSGIAAGETLTWRVRAVDKAGNQGSFSNYFSFSTR